MAQDEPGRTFFYMWSLVGAFQSILAPTPVDREIVIAIMWEETFYNNQPQRKRGTGQGFGQVEPSNFVNFDADSPTRPQYRTSAYLREQSRKARDNGYAVAKLPDVTDGRAATPVTNDTMGVKIVCAQIRHLFESKSSILLAYAGYFYVPEAEKPDRVAIVNRWKACADALRALKLSGVDDVYANQNAIANALGQAKGFADVRALFVGKLFPGKSTDNAATVDPLI
jgi:hypothetical protein